MGEMKVFRNDGTLEGDKMELKKEMYPTFKIMPTPPL